MKKAKTKNFSLPTTAASRHTTPLPGYFISSRFICEATIHLSSRFYYEATGDGAVKKSKTWCQNRERQRPDQNAQLVWCFPRARYDPVATARGSDALPP